MSDGITDYHHLQTIRRIEEEQRFFASLAELDRRHLREREAKLARERAEERIKEEARKEVMRKEEIRKLDDQRLIDDCCKSMEKCSIF